MSTETTLPGLDAGQQRAYENLHERHFNKAFQAANDIQEYIAYTLRDMERGQIPSYTERVLSEAQELARHALILSELRKVTNILKSTGKPASAENSKCPGPPHAGHASSDWTCPLDARQEPHQ